MVAGAMRILGIADSTSVHTIKWANGLARRGHHVWLLSFSAGNAARASYLPSVEHLVPALPSISGRRPLVALRSVLRLRSLRAIWRPDIVHAHFLGHGAWLAALAGNRPLVVSVMGGGDLVGTRWSPATAIERLLTPLTLKHAALVLCWSRNLERIVHEISGPRTRTAVLLGGIDRKTFCPGPPPPGLAATLGIPPGAVVVLSPRLFWPRQNIDTVVRGFAVFREHVEDAVLLLVRYRAEELPEYARTIDALVVDLGLHPHVRMLSTIPNEQMASYYRLASVTVSIPSTDGTPMSVAESLACETPVIVSDLPDYDPELFAGERTVLRIDPRDPRALGEALQRLAADAPLRERLAQTGAALVARSVDQDGEMDRLEAFYRTVIEEGHS